jgi:hypothetical protein
MCCDLPVTAFSFTNNFTFQDFRGILLSSWSITYSPILNDDFNMGPD